MLRSVALAVLSLSVAVNPAPAAQGKPIERQIAEAVSPLPKQMRDSATVLGYRQAGVLTVLREGTNEMICLADNPSVERFQAACYHEDLEPFMLRGRELRAEGKDRNELQAIRLAEIEADKLKVPDHPSALYSLTGREVTFDEETGNVEGAGALYVVYVPYATPEQLGLSIVPSRERPWLMDPGKPWAHIMIAGGRRPTRPAGERTP